jgi:prepilin-type N-terminal cleavage/methylation domain-containing protein
MLNSNSKGRVARTGFTLVELLVVLVIIGIASAVVAPDMSQWVANYRVKTVARQLATDLQFARMSAVANRVPCTVTVTPATNSYTITGVGTVRNLGDSNNPYYSQGVSLFRETSPGPPVTTSMTPVIVTFSALGAANPTGAIAVLMGSRMTRSVSVDAGGQIQIF